MELPIADFRTVAANLPGEPSQELMDTIYSLNRKQDWYRDYLKEEDADPREFVGSCAVTDASGDIASSIRMVLGVSETVHRTASDPAARAGTYLAGAKRCIEC